MSQTIYLAGVMTGLSFEEARKWRLEAKEILEQDGHYKTIDPCRGKEYLEGKVLSAIDAEQHGWGQTIFQRDRYDVLRSDVVLFNFLPATKINRVSIGTLFELCWAHEYNKYSIVVIDENNPNQHEFVKRAASLILPDLDSAYGFLLNVLNA